MKGLWQQFPPADMEDEWHACLGQSGPEWIEIGVRR